MNAPLFGDAARLHDRDAESFRPGRLWSLWEMLEKHAYIFVQSHGALQESMILCVQLSQESAKVTFAVRSLIENALLNLRRAYILSDLTDHIGPVDRLGRSVAAGSPASEVALEIKLLLAGLRDILYNEFYFHVEPRDIQFYLSDFPFGTGVAEKFPACTEDISEAAKCLALQRPTACVFHLMRVLESCVQRFGRKLKVKIDVRHETWHQIMIHVNKSIEGMPSRKAPQKHKKAKCAEAAAHLQNVRLAWRNEVMHPKQSYSRQEAINIYLACRVFVSGFSLLV